MSVKGGTLDKHGMSWGPPEPRGRVPAVDLINLGFFILNSLSPSIRIDLSNARNHA